MAWVEARALLGGLTKNPEGVSITVPMHLVVLNICIFLVGLGSSKRELMWGFDERSGESIDHSTDASCRPEHLYSHCFGCHFCTCLLIYAAYSHQTLLHALLLALALPDKHCSSSSSFSTFPCPALFAPPLLHILEPSSFLCLSFCLLCPTSSSSYTLPTACANFSASFFFHFSSGALASTSCFPSPAIVSIFARARHSRLPFF